MRYELHGYQPANAESQTLITSGELTQDTEKLEIPSCGMLKLEIAPDIWFEINISEWADCGITGKDGKYRCLG